MRGEEAWGDAEPGTMQGCCVARRRRCPRQHHPDGQVKLACLFTAGWHAQDMYKCSRALCPSVMEWDMSHRPPGSCDAPLTQQTHRLQQLEGGGQPLGVPAVLCDLQLGSEGVVMPGQPHLQMRVE